MFGVVLVDSPFLRLCCLFIIVVILQQSSAHEILPPVRHYDFLKKSVIFNLDSIQLDLSAFNTTYQLKLQKNEGLIVADSVMHLHHPLTGEKTKHSIIAHPYHGVLVDKFSGLEQGTARILFHDDPFTTPPNKLLFDGSFTHPDGSFHINTVDNYRVSRRPGLDIDVVSPLSRDDKHRTTHLILFKDVHKGGRKINSPDHMKPQEVGSHNSCGYVPSEANFNAIEKRKEKLSNTKQGKLYKRQTAVQSTCFLRDKRVLPMAVAADCSYVTSYGSPEAALRQIVSNWNQASEIYEATFNIQLAIIEVKVLQGCGNVNGETLLWNEQCSDEFTVNDRLSAFSQWRGSKSQDQAGLWHLMTKCNTGPSVGVAWLSMLCEKEAQQQRQDGVNQFVSGTGLSSIVPIEWKVVAHEIGHNFGAIHDCLGIQCPTTCDSSNPAGCKCCPCGQGSSCDCDGQFLMHPTDNSKLNIFSPCSIQLMCNGITQSQASCLVEPNTLPTVQVGQCGNGVREGDEECDCGKNCDGNNCCDGNTCRFKNGAQCDDSVDECCDSCQLKSAGTVCRESNDVCTFTQICDGRSGICPPSRTQPDGDSCTIRNGTGTTCASGVCTSRQLQCRSLVTSGVYRTVGPCAGQDNQCSLLCATASGTCLSLNGNFIEGTPCVGGGFCRDGKCEGSSLLGNIAYYFETQPQLAIPIAIAVGILLLTFLVCIGRACCCRKKVDPSDPKSGADGSKKTLQRIPTLQRIAARSRNNGKTNIYSPKNTSKSDKSSSSKSSRTKKSGQQVPSATPSSASGATKPLDQNSNIPASQPMSRPQQQYVQAQPVMVPAYDPNMGYMPMQQQPAFFEPQYQHYSPQPQYYAAPTPPPKEDFGKWKPPSHNQR